MPLPGWKSSWNSYVIRFLIAYCISLVFLDNTYSYLEETSCDPGDRREDICPDVYFSQSYLQARQRFRLAAQAAGAKLERYVMYEADGIEYTCDVAVLEGTSKNESVLVHLSGLHGVGGYAGSAAQLLMLEKWSTCPNVKDGSSASALWAQYGPDSSACQRHATVVFVHVVNPFGMANNRLVDHDNVYLLRNFIYKEEEWEAIRARNASEFAAFDDLFSPLSTGWTPTLWNRYRLLARALTSIFLNGYATLIRAVLTGQYHEPDNIAYGGNGIQPGTQLMIDIAKRFVNSTHVIFTMLNTGVGKSGHSSLLVNNEDDAAKIGLALPNHPVLIRTRPSGRWPWGSPEMLGQPRFRELYEDLSNGTTPTANVMDFIQTIGTTHEFIIGRDWIFENAAFKYSRGTFGHHLTQTWLRDAFCPQKLAWKRTALLQGEKVAEDALRFLNEQGINSSPSKGEQP